MGDELSNKSIEKLRATLERKIILLRECRHTKRFYLSLMDYHEFICSSKILTPVLQQIIAEEQIAPIYLKQIFNDFILIKTIKYNTIPNIEYPNFYTPQVEDKYKLLKKFLELIKNEQEDIKKNNGKIKFDPNLPVIQTERDDEYYDIQKLHNDIMDKLEDLIDNPTTGMLNFDSEKSILFFQGKEIKISQKAESDPHELLKTIFKNITKVWSSDEVLDDWKFDIDKKTPKKKIYFAGLAVNRIIAQETTIKDFLDITTKTVTINKKYLPT